MDIILWMLAVLVGYFVKGIAGIGNTLVVTAAMAYTRTNAEITPVELLLCVPTNLLLAWQNRRHIDWRLAFPPLMMVLAGDVVGVLLLKNVNVDSLKVVFGVVLIVLGMEMLWRELRGVAEKKAHPAVLAALGLSAGVLCGLFGAGALLAAYFARVTRDDKVYKGSMCMIFAAENIFRVVMCMATGLLTVETMKIAAILAVPMLAGLFAGMKLSGRMNARTMRLVIIGMLMLSGVPLLLTNL
ncbi:MAG: sulfite exporter TauE/SafE family protein [Clostridiales bacterium]|nr:sulfite exporter TauE/SafE family protein [Clostridiales bacterium]